MKILQITYSLTSGGAERLVVDLSNELSKYNEVHILTILDDEIGNNGFYKSILSKNIFYHCAYENTGMNIKKLYEINRIINKINPDIVHIHGYGIIYYFAPSILLNRKPKYIETIHTSATDIFDNWYSFIGKFLFKMNLIKMVTISNNNKFVLENVINIKNSVLINNGRSTPKSTSRLEEVKFEIKNLKNNENDIVFIHIGRCAESKNQKMLIEVFNKINEKGIGFILLILGNGFDSEIGKELQKNANSNIHFLGTKLNIIDYYLSSDAFCLSSNVEGLPISLIEAFACGCVPICTPTSGSSDYIIDGVNGFISEDFSEKSYMKAVDRFINNRFNINKLKLKQTYLDAFSIEICSKAYYQLYNNNLKI